jgi:Iron-containing redox enzyme
MQPLLDTPPQLPQPRGPLSAHVLTALRQTPHELPPAPPATGDVLRGDDDFHLTLYCLYELHYRGFEGVDDRWEWDPSLLRVRQKLESCFEEALRTELDRAKPPTPSPDELADHLKLLLGSTQGPSLSRYLEMRATIEEFNEVLVHKSAYQLKEADPHSFAVPRLSGRAKVAMVEIQFDEYGSGKPGRQHSRLFANTMRALGLDDRYGAYLDAIPGCTLAAVNLMSMCALQRRLMAAIVGHLAVLEMDSTQPNRRYGNGLRRLGFGPEATDFFDEHVEADAVHEALAAHDLAAALAKDDPSLTADIVFGARAMLLLDEVQARFISECWERGESSLLRPLTVGHAVT